MQNLLRRDGRGVALTESGRDYAQAARRCLQDLADASLRIRASGARVSLNLAIRPAFGMWWLAPRLRLYAARHPDISVNLGTRLKPFDFAQERFDAAIHFGLRDWPGMCWLDLAGEDIRRRLFTEGGFVRAGQPLYQIDASLYRAGVDQAAAVSHAAAVEVLRSAATP